MMERDLVSQGLNAGIRHQRLDWLELSVSAATAGFMGSTAGANLNKGLEKTFKKITPTITSELQTLTTTAATAALTGTHYDAAQILTDNLGSAIGNNLVQIGGDMGRQELVDGAIDSAKNALNPTENQEPFTLHDDLYLTDRVLDIAHPERTMETVYLISQMQKLNASNGYGVLNNYEEQPTSEYGSLYGSELLGFIENIPSATYQYSLFSFSEAVDRQIGLKGNECPKFLGPHTGSKGVPASRAQVSNAMDVEKLFADPVTRMQFLDLHYQEGISVEDLDIVLGGAGKLSGQGATFIKAGKEYNVNPIYLVAHALLESGRGTSLLAIENNNFFGAGAKDGHVKAGGAKFAAQQNWDDTEKGIIGAAKFISKNWINRPISTQTTLYSMRWNPMNPGRYPQYATDINWATKQTDVIYDQVSKMQQANPSFHPRYIVPKYRF